MLMICLYNPTISPLCASAAGRKAGCRKPVSFVDRVDGKRTTARRILNLPARRQAQPSEMPERYDFPIAGTSRPIGWLDLQDVFADLRFLWPQPTVHCIQI